MLLTDIGTFGLTALLSLLGKHVSSLFKCIITSIKLNFVAVILQTDYSWCLFTRCSLLVWHCSW